jgi:hypothetical protein
MKSAALILCLGMLAMPACAKSISISNRQFSCLLGTSTPEIRLAAGQSLVGIKVTCLTRAQVIEMKNAIEMPPIDKNGNQACVVLKKDDPIHMTMIDDIFECNEMYFLFESAP